jgi:hypothetical protein
MKKIEFPLRVAMNIVLAFAIMLFYSAIIGAGVFIGTGAQILFKKGF